LGEGIWISILKVIFIFDFFLKIRYKKYLLFVVIESHGYWNFSDTCELETIRWRVLFQIPFLGDIAGERDPFSYYTSKIQIQTQLYFHFFVKLKICSF
jgi:hypothetical protein